MMFFLPSDILSLFAISKCRRVDSLDTPFKKKFYMKGLPTAPHRTVRAVFPHTALQTNIGFQFQISVVKCGSFT